MEYGLLRGGAFTGRVQDFDGPPPDVAHKGLEWRPYVRTAPPPHDPLTQDLVGPGHDVTAAAVTQTWTVVDVAPAEALRRKQEAVADAREAEVGRAINAIVALAAAVDALANGRQVPAKAQAMIDRILQAATDNPDP